MIVRSVPVAVAIAALSACVGAPPREVRADARPTARPSAATLDRFDVGRYDAAPPALTVRARPAQSGAAPRPTGPLRIDDVLRSVEERFPLILAAAEEVAIAEGRLESARGAFDVSLGAKGKYGVDGYYQGEWTKLGVEQPTGALGATLFGGYKLGTGDFPSYEGDLVSTEGGEFSAGVRVPLLAGRAIDARRLAVWRARVERRRADPAVLVARLDATRSAAAAYWKWAAAGRKLAVYERLLSLAETRQDSIEESAAAGDIPRIATSDNGRLVVERRGLVIAAERALQNAAIELSLYLRDAEGNPRLADRSELPPTLPTPPDPGALVLDDDVALALRMRPELIDLELALESERLTLAKARNEALPKLDVGVAASDDTGDPISNPDTRGPLEVDLFFTFDLPLQRRAARGKARATEGKLRQLEEKLRYTEDKIRANVQDAASELRQTWLGIELAREAERLAGLLEEAERSAFDLGESNLIDVNIREQQTASAALRSIDTVASHFRAVADYRAAVGIPYDETAGGG